MKISKKKNSVQAKKNPQQQQKLKCNLQQNDQQKEKNQ